MATRRELEYILSLQDTTKRGFDTLEQRLKTLDSRFDKVGNTSEKAGFSAAKAFKAMGAAISTAAVADFVRDSVRGFAEFQKEVTLVGTLSDEAFKDLPRLTEGIRKMGLESGLAFKDLAKGLFDVQSAGTASKDSLDALEASMRLAVAGGADVATTTNGLTTLLNAFSLSGKESTRVANALFEAQQFGKTTVGELASSLGQVAPAARTANISMEELLGTMGAVTRQLPTRIAATSLAQFFYAIANASDDVIAKSREMADEVGVTGFEFSKAGVESKGFAVFLQNLSRVVGDDSRKLTQLGISTESMKGALVALQDGAKGATDAIALQIDAVTELDKGYKRMGDTASTQIERMTRAWEDLKNQFGKGVFEGLAGGADDAAKSLSELSDMFEQTGDRVGTMGRYLKSLATADIPAVAKAWTELTLAFGGDAKQAVRDLGTDRFPSFLDGLFGSGELSPGDVQRIKDQMAAARKVAGDSAAKPAAAGAAAGSGGKSPAAAAAETDAAETEDVTTKSLDKLLRLREDAYFELQAVSLSAREREVAETHRHFDDIRAEYADSSRAQELIKEAEQKEILAINTRYYLESKADAQRASDDAADQDREDGERRVDQAGKLSEQLARIVQDASLDRARMRGDEFAQLDAWLASEETLTSRHYEDLVGQAREFGLDTLALEESQQQDLEALREEYARRRVETERRAAEEAARERDRALRDATQGDDFGAGFTAQLELISSGLTAGAAGADLATASYGGLSDALFDIARNGKSAGEAFKAFGQTVVDELLRIAAKQLAISAIQGLFGLFSGGTSTLATAAISNATSTGSYGAGTKLGATETYARGGIAKRASIFGEDGPEAAVPLPDGRRIPVMLMGGGGGGGGVHITVHQTIAPQLIDARGADAVIKRSGKAVGDAIAEQLDKHEALRTRVRNASRGR